MPGLRYEFTRYASLQQEIAALRSEITLKLARFLEQYRKVTLEIHPTVRCDVPYAPHCLEFDGVDSGTVSFSGEDYTDCGGREWVSFEVPVWLVEAWDAGGDPEAIRNHILTQLGEKDRKRQESREEKKRAESDQKFQELERLVRDHPDFLERLKDST